MPVDQRAEAAAERFAVDATASTHFAWLRTRLAAERTLMAYNRTSIALIGFGFTIYEFLAKLNASKDAATPAHVNAPQLLGLMLIGSGLAFLVIGWLTYRVTVGYLNASHFKPVAVEREYFHTGTPLAAALLLVAGAFAFGAVLLRI